MKPQIIITIDFKGWSFEVYKDSGTVKVNCTESGEALTATEWLDLVSSINNVVQTTKEWKS